MDDYYDPIPSGLIYNMVSGKKYRIKWVDCCVQGEFTLNFHRYDPEDAESRSSADALFDRARISTLYAYEAEEV
jgi:hypothetical protein